MSLNISSVSQSPYGKLAAAVLLPLLIVIGAAIVIWDKFAIRTFFCLIEGKPVAFKVQISANKTIERLKEIIFEQFIGLPRLAINDITLFKIDIDLNARRDSVSQLTINENGIRLYPWMRVSQFWPKQPADDRVHIFVKLPAAKISSEKPNTSSVPCIPEYWSPRRTTVRRLYDILREENLVYVRGTPGTGKTALMNLLHAFILEQEPSAVVITQTSWPPVGSGPSLDERLRLVDPTYPRGGRNDLAYLLFDEAQESYQDESLWNDFFKMVCGRAYICYHIILFCSYGSPSSRPVRHRVGAPLVLRDAARISLWPREGSESDGLIGMLLNRSEFDEVVSRFECPLNLHSDLLDLIFRWTVGHVGAIIELLHIISSQIVSETEQFTVEMFHDANPAHELVQKLSHGAFGHGLPTVEDLSAQPDVAALFRDLLKNGTIYRNEYKDEDEALRKCHRHGWIHADLPAHGIITRYAFPSPLHAMCVSWRLEPTNDMFKITSLFNLTLPTSLDNAKRKDD